MKLWTEMKRDTDGEWFANDPDPNQCKGAIARDAVVAHALMQAIDAWIMAPEIKQHADDLMREWGFVEGEG